MTISRSTLSFHRESAKPELVDLRSVCESVRFLLQSAIEKRDIRFEILSEGDAHVEAFPGETRQVVLNLARNACEAIAENGRSVTLSLRLVGDGVELQVTDEGTGIPASVMATLFEFGKSSKGVEGNGMGLWTVKQIIEKHGGGDPGGLELPGRDALRRMVAEDLFTDEITADAGDLAMTEKAPPEDDAFLIRKVNQPRASSCCAGTPDCFESCLACL